MSAHRQAKRILICFLLLFPVWAVGDEPTTDRPQVREFQTVLFLCKWAKENAPVGNPANIRACPPTNSSDIKEALDDEAAWWAYWSESDLALANSLSQAFRRADLERRVNQTLHNSAAADAVEARKHTARLRSQIPTMLLPQLCALVRSPLSKEAHQELVRRKAFSMTDLALIADQTIAPGMAEAAMLCSLGPPQSSNRSVGSWGVNIQYVYGQGRYVYTENGKVTSWQD
jgi:hypothetical protein